jgi:hypothetical protein
VIDEVEDGGNVSRGLEVGDDDGAVAQLCVTSPVRRTPFGVGTDHANDVGAPVATIAV